jgi:hypothetical protein
MRKVQVQDPSTVLATLCARAGAMPPGRDRSRLLALALILSHTLGEGAAH